MKAMKYKNSGFTLIELLTVMVLAAVLLAIAIPSYRSLVGNNRLVAQANDLIFAFNIARSEAIKRGREVRVMVVSGSDWASGWEIRIDAKSDGDYTDDDDDLLKSFEALSGSTIATCTNHNLTTSSYAAFNSRGELTPSGDIFEVKLTTEGSDNEKFIRVETAGFASIKAGCSS